MNIVPLWLGLTAVLGLLAGFLISLALDRFPRAFVRAWLRDAANLLQDAQLVHNAAVMPEGEAVALAGMATSLTGRLDASVVDPAPQATRPWHRYALPAACAVVFPSLMHQFGVSPVGFLWCAAGTALLALAVIDVEMMLLPDALTLPLLWAGLGASALGLTIPLHDAVLGAVTGYLPLWLLYWAFKLATGREGMGMGDLKLLAALGAWLGWVAVTPVAAGAAVVAGLAHVAVRAARGAPGNMPFGPSLIISGLAVAVIGPQALIGYLIAHVGQ